MKTRGGFGRNGTAYSVIYFWTDSCCGGSLKKLEPLYRENRDNGLALLAVNEGDIRTGAWRWIFPLGGGRIGAHIVPKKEQGNGIG